MGKFYFKLKTLRVNICNKRPFICDARNDVPHVLCNGKGPFTTDGGKNYVKIYENCVGIY